MYLLALGLSVRLANGVDGCRFLDRLALQIVILHLHNHDKYVLVEVCPLKDHQSQAPS